MKSFILKSIALSCIIFMSFKSPVQDFQGKAFYFSKSSMELGAWGARMSEAEKKQTQERLKNRLEKTYILSFNQEESIFKEEVKVDAISGATDSWGNNFSRGDQYKNVKEDALVQTQEFYGKRFLVKDKLPAITWKMGKETKKIGQYLCFKASASVPTDELAWYDFSWGDLREAAKANDSVQVPEIKMTAVEAWYTLQIPVSNGPAEYWGLPGLILEVSSGNTTILCSKIILNPKEKLTIVAPDKGKEITKNDYQTTIQEKMLEMRNNRGRRN
jgi:GLPGLI family protein